MKRKIVSVALAVAMLGMNAYAAPSYVQDGNKVSVDNGEGYNTVMIKEQQKGNVVYVNQNDSGFGAAEEFFIQSNPADGTYELKMGKADGSAASTQTFTVLSMYLLSGVVDSNVKSITVKQGDAEIEKKESFGTDGTFAFNLPNGEYTYVIETKEGYELDTVKIGNEVISSNSFTINGAAISGLSITTKEKVYTISGTVTNSEYIASVKLVSGSDEYEGAISGESVSFTGVRAGTYTVSVEYVSGYESNGSVTSVVIGNDGNLQTPITISAKLKTYKVSGKTDNYITSVTITNGSGVIKTETVINNAYEFNEIAPDTYIVSVTTSDEEYYVIPFEIAVENDDKIVEKINATQKLYTVTGTVGTNISSVRLIGNGKTYQSTEMLDSNFGGTVTFNVPKGTYQINAVCVEGYKLIAGTTNQIEVAEESNKEFSLTAEEQAEPTYSITGTVGKGVLSVILTDTNGISKIQTVAENESDVTFTGIEAGEYTVSATYAEGYEKDVIQPETVTVTAECDKTNMFSVTAEIKTYAVSGTVGEHITAVMLFSNDTQVEKITDFFDGSFTFENVVPGSYTIKAETEAEYVCEDIIVEVSDSNVTDRRLTATLKTYAVTGTVDDVNRISKIEFVFNEAVYATVNQADIVNNAFSVILPAGTYSVFAYTIGAYDIAEDSTKAIAVANGGLDTVAVKTVERQIIPVTYTVNGTIDEGVKSILIKKDEETVCTIEEFEDNKFSFVGENGTYTITVTVKDGYEFVSITNNGVVEIADAGVNDIKIMTNKKVIEQPTGISTTTQIETNDNGELQLTTTLNNIEGARTVIVAAYDEFGVMISAQTDETENSQVVTKFEANSRISSFKILVWDSMGNMKPITNKAENVDNK